MTTFVEWIQGAGLSFLKVLNEAFLSENSRLWWAWILLTFPLIGAIAGAIELRREGQAITLGNLFRFVFPSRIYKSASFRNDLVIVFSLYAFYALVILFVSGIESKAIIGKLVGLVGIGLSDRAAELKDTVPMGLGIHLFFTFLVILAYDFGFTMLHYAFHKVPFLWKLHKVHHSAEHLTPFTVTRFHLGEYTLQRIFEGLAIGVIFGIFYFLLPASVDIYKVFGLSIFGILFSSIGVFRHSHIWISYGFMSYIFSSPAMHQIHHSKEPRHIDKNMAQIFSFWDYLLGTLYIPTEREKFEVGLAGEADWNKMSIGQAMAVHLKPDR